MLFSVHHILKASSVLTLTLLLFSCATYNSRINEYYGQVVNSNFTRANKLLDKNKILQAKRNQLLYLLEKGKITHLLKQYDSSNIYFNQADLFMEDVRTTAGDVALSTLLNPMMATYKGEDFEKFMIHYYKALNYLYLGNQEEAMVEARRITLASYTQQDKTNNRTNRYSDDAFSLMLQGLIYETDGDINNAFISYRNSADLFLKSNNSWYGVEIPMQLKKDLLRTASMNGFHDQVERYEKLFNTSYTPDPIAEGGELVVFWENGLAPVKREQNFFFALTKDGLGNFSFVDATGTFSIPFDFSTGVNKNDLKLSELRSLRVAFPKYEEQPLFYRSASVTAYDHQYSFEQVENINTIAFETLRQRFLREMGLALSRLAVKKLAEAAARPKSDDKNKNEKEALALAIQIFTLASEKADTRNWQSLPHTIYYTRIPLKKGPNNLTLQLSGGSSQSITIAVEGNGKLQIRNICSLR
jgi:hypothetical protein